MSQPDFLIVGAAKSGTTALYQMLEQHPDVFMTSPKEPHYFAFQGQTVAFAGPGDHESLNRHAVTGADDYRRLFDAMRGEKVSGEASVTSLYYPEAAARIRRHNPAARIIVVLRNPVERAYSSYLYMVAQGREPSSSFAEALDLEEGRIARGWQHIWHYRRMGFYADQLGVYLREFARERILVLFHEDLAARPDSTFERVCGFIGVDTAFRPRTEVRPNPSGIPRSAAFQRMLARPGLLKSAVKRVLPREMRDSIRRSNLTRGAMTPDVRASLVESYRADVSKLAAMCDRDLGAWLR
jgi:hypothetical protein